MTFFNVLKFVDPLQDSERIKRLDRKEAPFRNVGKKSPLGRWSKHTSIPTIMTNLAM